MENKALAIANNDIVYLWWTYNKKIEGCLGFSVRRIIAGKQPRALPAFVGFEPPDDNAPKGTDKHDTDEWPVQSYQWKDIFVPEETNVNYEIVPMTGTPGNLTERVDLKLTTPITRATDTFGPIQVFFNRGIISTQSLAAKLPKGPSGAPQAESLRKHIEDTNDPIRKMLAGEAVTALTSLLARARKEKGKCFLALYELTDGFLIEEIEKTIGHVELILSNADGSKNVKEDDGKKKTVKVYDMTNAITRKRLIQSLGASFHNRLLPKGNYIGHNKFVVYVDADNVPQAVLTGSTNWTATGLCAQSNNVIVIDNSKVAKCYLDYWHRLLDDNAKQAAPLRNANVNANVDADSNAKDTPFADINLKADAGTVRVWFSPNTKAKQKPKDAPPTPPDMDEVFNRIRGANDGVLFLAFSPGLPSILSEITAVAKQREADGKPFLVRGAISDDRMSEEFATRIYNDSILTKPNRLITGIGGIPDHFSFWQKELAKLGHAVIHDKIVVIDPFRDDCCVITGSHNQGFKASYSNDENFVILSGNRRVAEAYAAHVLDIVNHYNWRYKLVKDAKAGKKSSFTDLADDDSWQDKYFDGNFLASRDCFFFPPTLTKNGGGKRKCARQ
jgi:phosphatidylserine/phosphatidylglycerophosphate/cardiolipin synthase-like enzyme